MPDKIIFSSQELKQMADCARADALRAIRSAGSGHIGIALGAADIITNLFANHLKFDPANPAAIDRDRFVLSAGHGSALLYAVLKLSGYPIRDLEDFRKLNGLPGHPEYDLNLGIECTTGPLGQGLGMAVGMALSAKGRDNKVYCLCSDGDLMEGISQEAICIAGEQKLNNLILLWDSNHTTIESENIKFHNNWRFADADWNHTKIDAYDSLQMNQSLERAGRSESKPSLIECDTVLGLDTSLAGTSAAHAMALSDSEIDELISKFDNKPGRELWGKVAATHTGSLATSESVSLAPEMNLDNLELLRLESASTREISANILRQIIGKNPRTIIGGAADLMASVGVPGINFGVREHAMGAVSNGLALSGLRPYCGTFLVFSDYMRPAIRLSAMMKLPVVYVFSHDSIAVGEDGPTHQPIEQLASLRLIPNLNVFRPCNAAEVAAAWRAALSEKNRPSCIILSRQKFDQIETPAAAEISRGGYVIKGQKEKGKGQITLIATGAEVPLAAAVADILSAKKIAVSVVSMPSVETFRLQNDEYKNKILRGRIVAIEAGASGCWYEFADAVFGIDSFGRSGPGAQVLRSFGFDADAIAGEILEKIK
ncbi:MAG: transketolase [Rickettsiales bacterium]|jgi:transketolase|nr:transketolase [Rickettsiales bacterium]